MALNQNFVPEHPNYDVHQNLLVVFKRLVSVLKLFERSRSRKNLQYVAEADGIHAVELLGQVVHELEVRVAGYHVYVAVAQRVNDERLSPRHQMARDLEHVIQRHVDVAGDHLKRLDRRHGLQEEDDRRRAAGVERIDYVLVVGDHETVVGPDHIQEALDVLLLDGGVAERRVGVHFVVEAEADSHRVVDEHFHYSGVV